MSQGTIEPPPAVPASPLTIRRGAPRMQEIGLLVVVLAVCAFLWLASGTIVTHTLPPKVITTPSGHTQTLPFMQVHENKFLRVSNLAIVLTFMSWMAIMAMGQTAVIISGGIDISVGSMMGLSALVTAWVLQNFAPDASAWVIVPLGIGIPLAVGLLCGFINGALVVGLRMHPFIVTLATLGIFRWVCLKIGNANQGTLPSGDKVLPDAFAKNFVGWQTGYSRFGGRFEELFQPVPFIVMVLCLIAGWIYLRHMAWGRETYAVGGNEEAARFSGINVSWAKMRVYLISGLTAGIAGMLNCGYFRTASTDTGQGYELDVIAAAVVGGASLTGGRGTALGAMLGTLALQLILNGIDVLGTLNLGFVKIPVKLEDQPLIYGISIIVAVAVDQWSMSLQSRRSARLRAAH